MPQGAVLYRWGQVVPGREKDSMAMFQENVDLVDDFVEKGTIMGHYPYISTNREGGYWLVHGDLENLTDWTAEWFVGGSADELAAPMELAIAVREGTA